MIINLTEIGISGESFTLNRQSGELNTILSDLIGEHDYSIQFHIKALDQGFELTGQVQSKIPELCSRCGIDIKLKINKNFKELLLPKIQNPGHGEHYTRVNHYTDLHETEGPGVIECEKLLFNAGEYLHELIALQIPINPVGEVSENKDCLDCGLNVEKSQFNYDEPLPAEKNNPFSSLKNIKLN